MSVPTELSPGRAAYSVLSRCSWLLACAALIVALGGCSSSDGPGGGDGAAGSEGLLPPSCPEGVDRSVNMDTAIDLQPDTDIEDYICPRRDKDYYKVTVPANQNLLSISLQHGSPITGINLQYLIVRRGATPETDVVVARSPAGKNNRFDALHCLSEGTYFIQIQDGGDDAVDNKSKYRLSYKLESDQDSNEGSGGNNTPETATELTAATTGQLSCTEDADYYVVRGVAANQLLRLNLTTSAPTDVDYRYTVLRKVGDAHEALFTGQNEDGSREPTDLSIITAVPSAGDYFIRIDDTDNNDSDAVQPYRLEVTKLAELDTNEDNEPRNDHPNDTAIGAKATHLGDFNGTTATFVSSGRIGSSGDVDYFRIGDLRSGDGLAVVEIELEFPDDTKVDPSITLVYPTTKTCTKDKCCNVIDSPAGDTTCAGPLNCADSSFVCQDQGQAYCSDPECAGDSVAASCAGTRKCAGAVLCLKDGSSESGVCGATQFFRPTFQEVQDGGLLRTGQPLLHKGPWYLRVADQGGDEYDYDAPYQLRITIISETDSEPDNGYFPRLILSPDRDPVISAEGVDSLISFWAKRRNRRDLGADFIPKPTATGSAPFGWSPWIKGFISYETDVDHFRFNNPCHDNPAVDRGLCMLQAEVSATGSACPAATAGPGSGLEFRFTVTSRDAGATIPTNATVLNNTPRIFGYPNAAEGCQIMTRDIRGDIIRIYTGPTFDLDVFDAFRNNYSTSCGYQIRFRVSHVGCPAPPCRFDTDYAVGATVTSCYVGS